MANTYVPPGVTVKQEFTTNTTFTGQALPALIIGPNYGLHRYSVASEKTGIAVGFYDPSTATVYNWPNKNAGSVVDQSYAEVWFEQAYAKTFPSILASTSNIVSKVLIPNSANYYPNRVKSSALSFATNGNYLRSTDFGGRDVQIGDGVEVTDGSDIVTSKVLALIPDVVDAVVPTTATNESGNEASQARVIDGAVTWAGTGTAPSHVTVTNVTTDYVGYGSLGIVSDTYTVTVTEANADLTQVIFCVTSANGAEGSCGSLVGTSSSSSGGGTIEGDLWVDHYGNNAVTLKFVCTGGGSDLSVGNKWTVNMKAAVVQAVPVIGGTYTGSDNITYIATVVRGGPFYDGTNPSTCARIQVTSNDIDSSAAANVATPVLWSSSSSSGDSGVAIALGTRGLTISFPAATNNGGLILGDKYDVAVTGPTTGAVKTLVLQDNLLASWLSGSPTLTIKLFEIFASVEIPQYTDSSDAVSNWIPTATTITINENISVTDPNITAGGVPIALAVESANIYVQHRDLLLGTAASISSLTDLTEVVSVYGTVDADNPLAQGVYNALLNSNGAAVYAIGVISNDLVGFNAALALAAKTNVPYGIVPLTFDTSIKAAVEAHVDAMSADAVLKWRVAWFAEQFATTELLFSTNQGSNWTATVSADTLSAGTQYTLVTVAGATFKTAQVRTGDAVYINFRTNASGAVIYDTYYVDEVRTETTLTVTQAFPAAIVTPIKVQVARVYTLDEQVTAMAAITAGYANRRVRSIPLTSYGQSGSTLPGYFMCASVAGLRSGQAPHQGLTNMPIIGPTDLSQILAFSDTQLNTLAANGAWLVVQTAVNATPYTRHALTTDTSTLNSQEEMVTSNVDSMSYGFAADMQIYIGKYNINAGSLLLIRSSLSNRINFYQTETFTETAGNQLIAGSIILLRQDPNFADKVDAKLGLTLPYPDNYTEVDLIV